MLTDETCDCIAAFAYSRSDNGVAHVAAREKAVRNVGKVDGFGGRTTLFQRPVSATKITPEQSAECAYTKPRGTHKVPAPQSLYMSPSPWHHRSEDVDKLYYYKRAWHGMRRNGRNMRDERSSTLRLKTMVSRPMEGWGPQTQTSVWESSASAAT